MTARNKKFAKELKTALQEVKEEKTQPIDKLIQELNLKPEKRQTKIDSTTLIRKDRER